MSYAVLELTGVASFDYFFSIFFYFVVILAPCVAVLSVLVQKWLKK